MARSTFEEFKKEVLKRDALKSEYDKLQPEYELKLKLIKMRKKAGLTQEEIAQKMHTKKSNISRLESLSSTSSPRIATLISYANATGHTLKVDFE
jgi:DNA-binding XRE family transcriptional regulator